MDVRAVVRPARADDAPGMARVHVASWRETYRGLMPDGVLDDPGLLAARERFWTAALTDAQYAANRSAVAVRGDAVVGIAMSGPPLDPEVASAVQLYVLYLLAAEQGTGTGDELLDAVLPAEQDGTLWVADPNPRAQAFYRRRGFAPDGAERTEHGVREVRMVRPGR
ncbi:GNAT family N-acetyltransferase [Naasia aerilata]|uniref:N-acetyltransferase n=1 Tax=Naasia aerilata TaxID=1162966 RepID=A0ABN6XM65_9MICO|nr:GNAT family N-acetyltransferase [Naasia aerilata]BDZ45984.1 N-acetyltransferase [Naasia aerilata]